MFKIKGLEELSKQLTDIVKKTNGVTMEINRVIGQEILNDSRPFVPIDTGRLRNSGYMREQNKSLFVGYHAVNPLNGYAYAPIQHENLTFNHPRGGEAKYLENPVRNNMGKYEKMYARLLGGKLND